MLTGNPEETPFMLYLRSIGLSNPVRPAEQLAEGAKVEHAVLCRFSSAPGAGRTQSGPRKPHLLGTGTTFGGVMYHLTSARMAL